MATFQDRIDAQTAAAKARTASGRSLDLDAAKARIDARTAARRAAGIAEGTLPSEVGMSQRGIAVTRSR